MESLEAVWADRGCLCGSWLCFDGTRLYLFGLEFFGVVHLFQIAGAFSLVSGFIGFVVDSTFSISKNQERRMLRESIKDAEQRFDETHSDAALKAFIKANGRRDGIDAKDVASDTSVAYKIWIVDNVLPVIRTMTPAMRQLNADETLFIVTEVEDALVKLYGRRKSNLLSRLLKREIFSTDPMIVKDVIQSWLSLPIYEKYRSIDPDKIDFKQISEKYNDKNYSPEVRRVYQDALSAKRNELVIGRGKSEP